MGKITTVRGCIFCYLGNASAPGFSERGAKNLRVLDQLPAQDKYPQLSRNMFAVTSSSYDVTPFYKLQLIHFAASMKYLDEAWEVWLTKLEALFAQLDFERAEVRLELEWPPKDSTQTVFDYAWKRRPGTPRAEWVFEGGPRAFPRA